MKWPGIIGRSILVLTFLILTFVAAIALVYTYVLPKFFPGPGYGTYLPLMAGVLIPALIAGLIGYRVPTRASQWQKIGVGIGFAILAIFLVCSLSMLIIVNTRGE